MRKILILAIVLFLTGCSIIPDDFYAPEDVIQIKEIEEEPPEEEEAEDIPPEVPSKPEIYIEPMPAAERLWNILVYMPADNNLESAAIEDLSEMEMSLLNTDSVSVFVLLDRSELYDTSNGNWSGTKLYRLKTQKRNNEKYIFSEELECKKLGLCPGENVELDMSSQYVLEDVYSYVNERYPAVYSGLVMWGHGTGWRSYAEAAPTNIVTEITKGMAYDETSRTYMSLRQFGNVLERLSKTKKLDFVGFDTCFGAELEVAYELRNYVKYFAGSEGLLLSSGWNYKLLFDSFQNSIDKTPESFCRILIEGFKEWYATATSASFCVLDAEKVEVYFQNFEDYMKAVSEKITDRTVRDDLLRIIYTDPMSGVEKYTFGTQNSDIYLDIHSLVKELQNYFKNDTPIKAAAEKIAFSEQEMILDSWNSFGTDGSLGIYFQTLAAGDLLSAVHPAAYIKGRTSEQISFVLDSNWYVPDSKSENSFLEKLFYKKF